MLMLGGMLWSSLEIAAGGYSPAACVPLVRAQHSPTALGESSEPPSRFLKAYYLPRNPLPQRLPAVWASWLWEKQLHVSITSWQQQFSCQLPALGCSSLW